MVELLLALPMMLLLGLGVVQYTLVYQAKHALDYALTQAARQGAVDHASVASIEHGLAVGLAPYLFGADDWPQLLEAEGRALTHIREGAASGWIHLRQRSPSQESFDDWAEPALDPFGETIPGLLEIANDNLDSRRLRMQPASGLAGLHLSEPIGQHSGQSLADANLLRLELIYGMRLIVPLVGPLLIRTLSVWNRCGATQAPRPDGAAGGATAPPASTASTTPGSSQRLGLLLLAPIDPLDAARPWMCVFLESGSGRIPLRTSATMRMMSPARRSDMTQSRSSVGSGRSSAGAGTPGPAQRGFPLPDTAAARTDARTSDGATGNRQSTPAAGSGLADGFLSIGGNRLYGMPRSHPALCPT